MGDKNVSLTQGVISKYMCIPYSQQATILMPAIHVSAAINGGRYLDHTSIEASRLENRPHTPAEKAGSFILDVL